VRIDLSFSVEVPAMNQSRSVQTGARLLVRSLESQGVPFIFGIPGGAISPILDALADGGPRFIPVRHESAGAFMAQAYGRCTGKPGVVMTTSGPGLINAVCGVATAQADRDPVVAITGQVPRGMRFKSSHQNLDTVSLFAPITKWSVGIEDPDTIPEVLANAFRVAARPRPGAVHVSIPSDVSRAGTQMAPLAPVDPAPGGLPADQALDRAASLLGSARRPVLLLGVGSGERAAAQAIRRLLRKAALPVACTFEGNGVIPRDLIDHFVGRVGYTHNQPADRLLQQADVVACVGYDLIEYDPTEWLGPATTIVHIDEIPATIDRAYRPAVELVGDLARTIDALAARLEQLAADDLDLIREARSELATEESRGAGLGGCPVHPLRILHDLGRVIGDDVTVTCDVGAHQIWTARYFFRYVPRRLFFSMGHQTMGVGLPWAIGAALARPGESAVSISGDGSFLMTCMELETAVRLKLPTVHLVWRDGSYNLVGLLALREYGREVGTHFGPTDFVALAHSFGAAGFRVKDANDLRPMLEQALALKTPAVIEIPVDYRDNLPLVQPMRLRAVD
jgi:acetolactate synthase I/II/III large subunit